MGGSALQAQVLLLWKEKAFLREDRRVVHSQKSAAENLQELHLDRNPFGLELDLRCDKATIFQSIETTSN